MDKTDYFYYLDKAKRELSKGRIEPSIVFLQDCLGLLSRSQELKFSCKEIRDNLIGLLSRYARCKNSRMNGAVAETTIEYQLSGITDSIIKIIGEIEDIMDDQQSSIIGIENEEEGDVQTLVLKEVETMDIEIHINKKFENFSESDRKKLMNAIGNLLEMDEADIKIKRIRPGSVRITFSLPEDKAKKLLRVIQNGDLEDINVTNAKVGSGNTEFIAESGFRNYLPMNIKALRRRLSFSQEELAEKLGLNRGNIASYENGSAEPKISNLLKFSSLFGVSITDLTQKDLREEYSIEKATENFLSISENDHELIQEYTKKAEEMREFMEGLTKVIDFKKHAKEGLPKDLRHVIDYYEQLHEASLQLIHTHRSLIDFVKKKAQ